MLFFRWKLTDVVVKYSLSLLCTVFYFPALSLFQAEHYFVNSSVELQRWHATSSSETSPLLMHHTEHKDGGTRALRHVSAASQDTAASYIIDGTTTSYRGSLRLSQFPIPPASTPTTPLLSEFGTPSPNRGTFAPKTAPLIPQRKRPAIPVGGPITTTPSRIAISHIPTRNGSPHPPSSHTISPYDWHDGASSISMDATEDRLLSTSFITSLLQENTNPRENQSVSFSSDASSAISELTYPPQASRSPDDYAHLSRFSSPERCPPPRPYVARPPPSAFMPIPESPDRLSGDSVTLYSSQDHNFSMARTMDLSQGLRIEGESVRGILPVMLQRVDINPMEDSHGDVNHKYLQSFTPPMSGTRTRSPKEGPQTPQTRESVHSAKSIVPSIISRISSSRSVQRVLAWRKVKPLPSVPSVPRIPVGAEVGGSIAGGSRYSLEHASRVGTPQTSVDKGYHPHQNLKSHYLARKIDEPVSAFDDSDTIVRETSAIDMLPSNLVLKPLRNLVDQRAGLPGSTILKEEDTPRGKRKRPFIILGVFFMVTLAAVGATVGVTLRQNRHTLAACSGDVAGVYCNLNATCVCTSPLSTRCDGLAQNIVDLIPILNRLFTTNLTNHDVYNSVWLTQGAVLGSNCASQSRLVDVAPALQSQMFPNITQWAQTALLWNLVQSQDLQAVAKLQNFILHAPWKTLQQSNSSLSSFSTNTSGFTFNFATQEVTQPSVSFSIDGQPTSGQLAQVGPIAHSALDRMYSFAAASSDQRQKALINYWTTVLQQSPADLAAFMSALSGSPVLLPFDATSSQQLQPVASLLTTSASSPFPPPLGCYPGLESAQTQQINAVEVKVFGLPPMTNAIQFDPACYPDRPVYGVLDVLRLRQPFLDSSSDVARQAAVLKHEVSPRVLVHAGEMLSSLPATSNITSVSEPQLDPRRYGTLNHLNHVVLDYLSSIPDIDLAIAFVEYVLNATFSPPINTSALYRSIASLPVIEVAVFGSIDPSDIGSAVSSFTASSSSLFFGSDQGTALRNWAITAAGGYVAWSESALSPFIVHDSSFSDPTFNQTWTAISTALRNNVEGIGLVNITNTFQLTGKFTPT